MARKKTKWMVTTHIFKRNELFVIKSSPATNGDCGMLNTNPDHWESTQWLIDNGTAVAHKASIGSPEWIQLRQELTREYDKLFGKYFYYLQEGDVGIVLEDATAHVIKNGKVTSHRCKVLINGKVGWIINAECCMKPVRKV